MANLSALANAIQGLSNLPVQAYEMQQQARKEREAEAMRALQMQQIQEELARRRVQDQRETEMYPIEKGIKQEQWDKAQFENFMTSKTYESDIEQTQAQARRATAQADISEYERDTYFSRLEAEERSKILTEYQRELLNRRKLSQAIKENPDDPLLVQEYKDTQERIDKLKSPVLGATEHDLMLKGANLDKLIGRRDELDEAYLRLEDMIGRITEDPSVAGFTGMLRSAAQTAVGIASDVGLDPLAQKTAQFFSNMSSLIKADISRDNMEEEAVTWFERNYFDPTVAEIPRFEISMSYLLARLNKPDDRIAVKDIENALKVVKITGFLEHSAGVKYNLNQTLNQIKRSKIRLDNRINAKKGQIPESYYGMGEEEVKQKLTDPAINQYILKGFSEYGITSEEDKRAYIDYLKGQNAIPSNYPYILE